MRLGVLSMQGDAEAQGTVVGAAVCALVFGLVGVLAARADLRAGSADASGMVAPAAHEQAPTRGRWELDEMAAQLARQLAPMNGAVFREGRSRRLRVMLDPASAIQLTETSGQAGSGDISTRRYLQGDWWKVTWRRGRAPKIRAHRSTVTLRYAPGFGPIPGWRSQPARTGSMPFVREPQRPEGWSGELHLTSHALVDAVDQIAVDSGWASRGQISAQPRQPQSDWDRHVSVVQEGGGRTSTRISHGGTIMRTTEEVRRRDALEQRISESRRTSSSARAQHEITSTSALPPRRLHPSTTTPEELRAAAAAMRAPRTDQAGGPVGLSRQTRMLVLLGAVILCACFLATGIGLIAGMVWWASFIIIGGGLLFCLLFVLPFILFERIDARR